MISTEAMSELNLKQPPAIRQTNFQYLSSVWHQEIMCTFKNFLRWYNNKHVDPTLEVLRKMVDFYHKKGIGILKLGCNSPNLANICLHKSTTAMFYHLQRATRILWWKYVKTWLVDQPLFSHGKLLWTRLLFGIRQILCKSIVGSDASQF